MNGLKAESFKYSPVQMLPADQKEESTQLLVIGGEQKQLFTRNDTSVDFKNTTLNIDIGQSASLHHWHLFDEGQNSTHIQQLNVSIARNGRYTLNALTIGSKWSRVDIHIRLLGEGAECHLGGLDLGKGSAHVDRHLLIEHVAPHTTSSQLFKGIFDEQASASFFGKIKVHHGADGTSATQVDRNLLLSPNATVNSRPQLEIDTDDVACTHGATVGQLDDNAVFFLRSRGLSEDAARSLLTEAFASEVIKAFAAGEQRDEMERRVRLWLKKEAQ